MNAYIIASNTVETSHEHINGLKFLRVEIFPGLR